MPEVEILKPEEAKEIREKAFTRRVAFITAVFAVILSIASLGGNNATKDMLLAQQESSNQWAFYQAKAMREHLYRNDRTQLEMSVLMAGESLKPEVIEKTSSELNRMKNEEDRFREEKAKIERKARQLEEKRDISMAKDPYFDYAEVLLQISIVLASIAIISVSPVIFYMATLIACLGSLLCLNGFLMLFRLPFLG
jgi:hypothetical protein